jgi:hypothetical protein
MNGSSVATAKVTGAVSQVWAANPDLSYRQVLDLLKDTATDLNNPNWDEQTGAGLLNIATAVNLARVTTPEEYDPPELLVSDKWGISDNATPGERPVQKFEGAVPYGRRIYKGWLNDYNPSDEIHFSIDEDSFLQWSLDFPEGSAKLYREDSLPFMGDISNEVKLDFKARLSNHKENADGWLYKKQLTPGDYYIKVDKGRIDKKEPYELTLNFDRQDPDNGANDTIWLDQPIPPQPDPVAPEPPENEEPDSGQPDPNPVDPEPDPAEQIAKENAIDAIEIAESKNSWLGESTGNVELDLDTLTGNRAGAIQRFENGYIIWNGHQAIAYEIGDGGNPSFPASRNPQIVRLFDLGMLHGRHESNTMASSSNNEDLHKFRIDNSIDTSFLYYALRDSLGNNLPLSKVSMELLDQNMEPIEQGNIEEALSSTSLDGGTYYLKVNPKVDNLSYKVVTNLDTAGADYTGPDIAGINPRDLGVLTGRQQFYDYVGHGDRRGDVYKYEVKHPSHLVFDAKDVSSGDEVPVQVNLLDSNGNRLDTGDEKNFGTYDLEPGTYYFHAKPDGNAESNYRLVTQVHEKIDSGRQENKNREISSTYGHALHRIHVSEDGANLAMALRDISASENLELELYRDEGKGILDATKIAPNDVKKPSDEIFHGYEYLDSGNYLVKVSLKNQPESTSDEPNREFYDLVTNLDETGDSFEDARDLGDLSGQRKELREYVGKPFGEKDVYKFSTDEREIYLAMALRELEDNAKVTLYNEDGEELPLQEKADTKDSKFGKHVLEPNSTYYVQVEPLIEKTFKTTTNYKLVLNLKEEIESGGDEGAEIIDAIENLNVEGPYYERRDITGDSSQETFCNWFVADVLDQLGVPISRHDGGSYAPNHPLYGNDTPKKPHNANRMYSKFEDSDQWKSVSPEEAAKKAKKGLPAVVAWKNPYASGHVAIVRPDTPNNRLDNPQIAQAGWDNYESTTVTNGFGSSTSNSKYGVPIKYFVYQG